MDFDPFFSRYNYYFFVRRTRNKGCTRASINKIDRGYGDFCICGSVRRLRSPGLFLCGRRWYQTRSRHVANTHLLRESSRRVPAACFMHYMPYLPRDAGGQMRKWTRPLFPFFVEKEEKGEEALDSGH